MLFPQFVYVLLCIIGIVTADNIMQKAIKAFADSNFVTCHILLFTYSDSFREQKILQDLYQIAIKNNFIPTALENMNNDQRRNSSTSIRRDCAKPLRSFIMGNVTYIAEYMIAEKKKGNIATEIWLLFVTNDFDQELIISQVELSISSEVYIVRRTPNGYKFWEVYCPTKNNPVRVIHHGDWSFAGGLKTTQQSKIQRRWDFGGAVFRAAAVDMKSYKNSDLIRTVKVLTTLWQTLEKEFNFTTEYVMVPESSSKSWFRHGLQDVIKGILTRKEADVSIAGVAVESSDIDLIDFSEHIMEIRFKVFIKKCGGQCDERFYFLKPLNPMVWYHVGLVIAISPVTILFVHRIGCKLGIVNNQWYFTDVCVMVLQMLCLQGGTVEHKLLSMGLLLVSFNIWAFMFRTMYSAAFTSTIAVKQFVLPFISFREMLKNRQYELGVVPNSKEFELLYHAKSEFMKQLNKAIMEQNITKLPTSHLEGLQWVCSRKRYAFSASVATALQLQSALSCELSTLRIEHIERIAVVMSNNNEYLPFINRRIHELHESGIIGKWIHDVTKTHVHTFQNLQPFEKTAVASTRVIQLILLGGILSSIVILLIEILYYTIKKSTRVWH